jgi:cytochrome bd-type quinol oxidase subunit 2
MKLSAMTESDKRRMLALAGLVAVPVYVLPVGLFGLRALWPRTLRTATSGAITLGMLSLLGLGLRGLARAKTSQPGNRERWKLPFRMPVMPEEFAASAASGH